MEYKVVASEDFYGFQSRVNNEISDGWVPCGGMSVSMTFDHHVARIVKLYCQAMTRPQVKWAVTSTFTNNDGAAVVTLNEINKRMLAR